jgi:hypothetical protein
MADILVPDDSHAVLREKPVKKLKRFVPPNHYSAANHLENLRDMVPDDEYHPGSWHSWL